MNITTDYTKILINFNNTKKCNRWVDPKTCVHPWQKIEPTFGTQANC